jgi:hypothetical protein
MKAVGDAAIKAGSPPVFFYTLLQVQYGAVGFMRLTVLVE